MKFNLCEIFTIFPTTCLDQFDIEILNFPTHLTKTQILFSCLGIFLFSTKPPKEIELSIFNYVSRDSLQNEKFFKLLKKWMSIARDDWM